MRLLVIGVICLVAVSIITLIRLTGVPTSLIEDFLAGNHCLTPPVFGWWKYEFCFGRHVRQFHIDKSGETSVIFGIFDEEAHKKWMRKNADRFPPIGGERTELSLFYQDGSVCEHNGQKRHAKVKLRCMENATSPNVVSMYLSEPETCQYVLGFDSPLICDILQKTDKYGLITKYEKLVNNIDEDDEDDNEDEDEEDENDDMLHSSDKEDDSCKFLLQQEDIEIPTLLV